MFGFLCQFFVWFIKSCTIYSAEQQLSLKHKDKDEILYFIYFSLSFSWIIKKDGKVGEVFQFFVPFEIEIELNTE